MPLVTIQDLSIRFRGPALLDAVDCIVEPGHRIGLLGRNGAGKTTLLRLLAGDVEPDEGKVDVAGRVAWLPQDVPQDLAGRVADVVAVGVDQQAIIDAGDEPSWQVDHRVDQILSRMELDPEAAVESMSSGMKRRVLLARALVDSPDLLLLDEPTNHLDIAAIRWLEDFLDRWNKAFVFITHDRQFLRRLATRILEIDRGKIFDWTCNYDTFLQRKQDALDAEEKQNALFDKKLAEEEAWIRQGIKARRTRNEGRVRALKKLREERSDRREKVGSSQLQIHVGAKSGNLVAHLEKVSFAHTSADGAKLPILDQFSTTIMRGDKVGIIGPNGAGKTTLLRLLLGKREPQTGTVRLGTNLKIAYFDQLRDQLDGERTIEEDVSDGYTTLQIDGQSRHILGYLQDFLFTPERARTQIKRLSGGERNRVLLAKLFAKPANVIVLDEPTNDLDAETLEMLEERLVAYTGTLLVVSHDREFLNNVVTSSIVFEPEAEPNVEPGTASDETLRYVVREYVGGYDDWQRQRAAAIVRRSEKKTSGAESSPGKLSAEKLTSGGNSSGLTQAASVATVEAKNAPKPKKLNFKETQELKTLPGTIEKFETQIAAQHEKMADPEFYKQAGDALAAEQAKLSRLETELATAYSRWEELEARNG